MAKDVTVLQQNYGVMGIAEAGRAFGYFREDRPGEYTPAHSWVAWEHIQLLSRYVLRVPRLP